MYVFLIAFVTGIVLFAPILLLARSGDEPQDEK